ncbi:hypothetical protein ACWDY7_15375 [Streptomyces calvus]|uniref:Uncharacterized protein n=1 Tax=Streptomyces calvus TaxID=67282 RepID=A0AA40SH88_9ACTN|nr:hypothetical protein [Streptomyces calvus]MBA8946484.1 hypothetical protein [Streptomyces calvus]GGP66490.1 hypothetical protein GCM10010247_44350 [Streptomyces calvus]
MSVLIGTLQLEVDIESREEGAGDAKFVQMAGGIVFGIETGDLVSVWLHPVFAG